MKKKEIRTTVEYGGLKIPFVLKRLPRGRGGYYDRIGRYVVIDVEQCDEHRLLAVACAHEVCHVLTVKSKDSSFRKVHRISRLCLVVYLLAVVVLAYYGGDWLAAFLKGTNLSGGAQFAIIILATIVAVRIVERAYYLIDPFERVARDFMWEKADEFEPIAQRLRELWEKG